MPDFYGDIAEATTYHALRGNAAWAGAPDSDKTAALVRGSTYVDAVARRQTAAGTWSTLFPGVKTGGRAQLLDWPRTGAADYEGNAIGIADVPIEVRRAAYEAALRELVEPGSLSPDYVPSEQVKREKAGPFEEEYFGPADGAVPNRPIVSIILDLLAPVLLTRALDLAIMVV